MNNLFSNREIAVAIWTIIAVVGLLFIKSVRKASLSTLKALLNKHIVISIAALIFYSLLIVLVFYGLNFWHLSDLKETIYWFFGIAFVMLVNAHKINNHNYFKRILLGNIKLAIFLGFLIKLYVFGLWLELILVPFMTFILLLKVVSETDEKYSPLDHILGKIQIFIGSLVLIYVASNIVSDFSGFATSEHLQEFVLPIALTTAYLPFIYLVALYTNYQNIFTRLSIFNDDKDLIRYAKRKIFFKYHFNLNGLAKLSKKSGIPKIASKSDIPQLIGDE